VRSTPMYFLPYMLFFLPDAVGLERLPFLVGGQHHRKLVFCSKFVVAFDAIRGNADDDSIGGLEFRAKGTEIYRFGGAAGCVVLRVEIENDRLASQAGQCHRSFTVAGQSKIGGRAANRQFCHNHLSFAGMLSESRHIRYIAKPGVVQC